MNFFSANFHLHYLANYTLYIQSDFITDHITVVNQDNEVLVYLQNNSLQPDSEVTKLLSYPFSKIVIGLPHQGLVWIPQEVYQSSEKALYAPYFVEENPDLILETPIDSLAVVALHQFDQFLLNKWKNIFPQAIYAPIFVVLIKQLSGKYHVNDCMVVHIYENKADIILFMNGDFKLYNTFEVATADDLSYFVISVLKNFGIAGKIPKVFLSGVAKDSDWGVRVSSYAIDFEILEPQNRFLFPNKELEKKFSALNILVDLGSCV